MIRKLAIGYAEPRPMHSVTQYLLGGYYINYICIRVPTDYTTCNKLYWS